MEPQKSLPGLLGVGYEHKTQIQKAITCQSTGTFGSSYRAQYHMVNGFHARYTYERAKIRTLNIIDDYNREVLNMTIDTSLNSKRVIRELEQLVSWRGIPDRIRVDNGPEFISERLSECCSHPERDIDLKFIQKGKPAQNGYIERFNRSYGEEVLSAYLFDSIEDVRDITNQWIWEYNKIRPHDSLMNLPPTKFLLKYGKMKEFPTFQQDINIKRKHLDLTAAN